MGEKKKRIKNNLGTMTRKTKSAAAVCWWCQNIQPELSKIHVVPLRFVIGWEKKGLSSTTVIQWQKVARGCVYFCLLIFLVMVYFGSFLFLSFLGYYFVGYFFLKDFLIST